MKSYESSYVQPRSHKSRWFWALIGIATLIVIAIVIGGGAMLFAVRPVRIEGQAMSPTLKNNDKALVLKQFDELQRSDIVVFLYPEDQSKSYIQRIIGLPGETIDVKDGKVYICNFHLLIPFPTKNVQPRKYLAHGFRELRAQ